MAIQNIKIKFAGKARQLFRDIALMLDGNQRQDFIREVAERYEEKVLSDYADEYAVTENDVRAIAKNY